MLVNFLAPEPWRSRGQQLLWLLPAVRLETDSPDPDLTVSVREGDEGLQLTIAGGGIERQRLVPAEAREFLVALFSLLSEDQGKPLSPWGVLTGVRPGKVAARLLTQNSVDAARQLLVEKWRLQPDKARLLLAAVANGYPVLKKSGLSLYVSVPFCPSRCHYCSFASLPIDAWQTEVDCYLGLAAAELGQLLAACRQGGIQLNSIYVGGGTPTVLTPGQIAKLLAPAAGADCEFTVEAGRPDTLTPGHLTVFKELGVNRLSINCQYPRDETLAAIGRRHSAADFWRAMALAAEGGLGPINSDLIVGLPGQRPADFAQAVAGLAAAGADNITIHALALKRGAGIKEQYIEPAAAEAIAARGYDRLAQLGYAPYYLYRQRNIASNLENVGFGREGRYCYYNIASVAESEPILGVGAGALSKLGWGGTFSTAVNPRDIRQYAHRHQQLLQRKLDWVSVKLL